LTVSVFITSYNQKDLLREAIESVLAQTRLPDEIVIADDCSSDGSQELIGSYERDHPDLIRPVFQDRNIGIPRNKNAAYRATTGDWVTYLDGDDRFLPNKIETDLAALDSHPEAEIACSNFFYINSEGSRDGAWADKQANVPTGAVDHYVFARTFPRRTIFRNEMVRRDKLEAVDFMDPQFAMYHDWELRIRLSQSARLVYSHQPTSEYRRNPEGISSSQAGRHLDECVRIYEKHRRLIESYTPQYREFVNRNVRPWIGRFAWRAFRNALERHDHTSAWSYLIDGLTYAPQDLDWRAVSKWMLPQQFVRGIQSLRR
jgi:glycosyltransferase involved in cell wall biosynthesis